MDGGGVMNVTLKILALEIDDDFDYSDDFVR